MSRTFRTPDKRQQRKRATISHTFAKSSTPNENTPVKHYSISLSGIDTGSSSSTGKTKKRLRSQVQANELIDDPTNFEKGKRKKTADKKRRVVTWLADNDSEWETTSEELIKETPVNARGFIPESTHDECHDDTPACCNLFEDPCTPEKVRDAPMQHELLPESPIIQSSRRLRFISAKNNVEHREKLLPVSNLRLSETRDVSPDETDDELIFHHEKDVKTYSAPPKRKKSPERTSKNFSFPLRFLTATSDLLWDEFVDKFRDEISQYLAPSFARVPVELTDSACLPNVDLDRLRVKLVPPGMKFYRSEIVTDSSTLCTNSELEDGYERENAKRRTELETDGRGTKTRRRKMRKRKRKGAIPGEELIPIQKRKADIYDQFDETDIEFETGGPNKKRISFRTFCCKQRKNNKTKALPTSSHSDT
ncbi:PREDICTED: uncharacterized protein LOC106749559 [Dinoponera quadriceps]|uniref:Uncharacterized protein LOC106749559 n=1 Tax=Dinoponera quadriceps TaxID=609295 RepID=A0A6P3Y1E2_DINQU|nr:PREDICTED: uncharacterized protein LOC106749559 [Dinoponera quadriceps]